MKNMNRNTPKEHFSHTFQHFFSKCRKKWPLKLLHFIEVWIDSTIEEHFEHIQNFNIKDQHLLGYVESDSPLKTIFVVLVGNAVSSRMFV